MKKKSLRILERAPDMIAADGTGRVPVPEAWAEAHLPNGTAGVWHWCNYSAS